MTQSYSPVTKTLHWLTALLILSAFPLGLLANNAPFATSDEIATKALLFSLHKTIGVTAFFTALIRILWALTQTPPADLYPDRRLETFAAHLVHWLLYISMLLVPLTGWINHAASTGFAPIWGPFGQSLPLVPKSETVSALFSAGHWVFTKILLVTVALHIAGALKHVFIDRDDTLRRMLPGKIAATPATNRSRAPMLAAAAIYSAAIALGIWLGQPTAQADTKQLASVNSDWSVTDGTLGLTVTQFGSDVSGNFTDWTAQISFDPATGIGNTDVTVNIASLSLGSVSAQALGPDFFDAANHPTAHFSATIAPQGDHFTATGTLTVKGKEQPLTLPFTLDITDGTATMQGEATLNRLDFGIGEALPDETTLKFPVAIEISLTATR
ncbi:cytochrome b/b6 domain-containing protein [Profundibacter sp.]|uniref:cytochrome b/b6 domain-containing protein n=1 Tax=Profundibacter sp. TaxID=3101071 RepID=UPI003D0D997D